VGDGQVLAILGEFIVGKLGIFSVSESELDRDDGNIGFNADRYRMIIILNKKLPKTLVMMGVE